MSERRFPRLVLVFGLGAFVAGCGPVSAALHDSRSLPALEEDSRVHYEPGAEAYAREAARLLPRAMAKVEAAHGRPFGKQPVIAAFLDEAAYAAANGVGSDKPAGVAFFDRVALSPRIWREEPRELEAYLAHELSHAHLHIHVSLASYAGMPAWFQEGLAVMASDGGGAQRVSEHEARRAILDGKSIATPDKDSWFAGLKPPAGLPEGDMYRQMHMAYRQAGMFVSYLRRGDPAAFEAFLARLHADEGFKSAFEKSFGSSVAEKWRGFSQSLTKDRG